MRIYFESFELSKDCDFVRIGADFGFLTCTDLNSCDVRVIANPIKKSTINADRDVVLLVEPQTVRPDLYSPKYLSKLKYVLPLGPYRAKRLGLNYYFNLPVTGKIDLLAKSNSRPKNIVMFSGNKYSTSKRSQYGFRKKVIREISNSLGPEFDLYGDCWNAALSLDLRRRLFAVRSNKVSTDFSLVEVFSGIGEYFQNYRGFVNDQFRTLLQYQKSIVIENDLDYVSEKVWSSIFSGSVCIYVGPDLEFHKDLLEIVVHSEPGVSSVLHLLTNLSNLETKERRERGLDFLSSKDFEPFKSHATYQLFWSSLSRLLV